MDRGAWWATVLGVAKSRTQLSNFTHSLIIKKAILMMQERDRRTARIQCTSGGVASHRSRKEARTQGLVAGSLAHLVMGGEVALCFFLFSQRN